MRRELTEFLYTGRLKKKLFRLDTASWWSTESVRVTYSEMYLLMEVPVTTHPPLQAAAAVIKKRNTAVKQFTNPLLLNLI